MSHSQRVVSAALAWLGTPYRHQASCIGAGCDCLGLVRGVWRELYGMEVEIVPPYAQFGRDKLGASLLLDAAKKHLITQGKTLENGHVLLFQLHKQIPPRHCGIMINQNQLIHAQERLGVVTINLHPGWRAKIHSTYSFPAKV